MSVKANRRDGAVPYIILLIWVDRNKLGAYCHVMINGEVTREHPF